MRADYIFRFAKVAETIDIRILHHWIESARPIPFYEVEHVASLDSKNQVAEYRARVAMYPGSIGSLVAL